MSKLSADAVKRLQVATASKEAGNELADAVNKGEAHAVQGPVVVAAAIQATATSQTTDFGALKVGDKVAMIAATPGNADYITISVAGDLGQAAVIGNLYLVFRPFVAPAAEVGGF